MWKPRARKSKGREKKGREKKGQGKERDNTQVSYCKRKCQMHEIKGCMTIM
jgi:hypothetical protein